MTMLARYVALLSFLMISALVAHAQGGQHGHDHNQLHSWYEGLKQPGTNTSCCNQQDCRSTVEREVNGELQVMVDGEWTSVPQGRILHGVQSPDLSTHVCAPKQPNAHYKKGHIFCVIRGAGA